MVLSVAAAAFVLAMVFLGGEEGKDAGADATDRWFVGAAYLASCVVGISLALRPNWVRTWGCHGEAPTPQGEPTDATATPPRGRLGHHPDCGPFDGHRVRFDRARCAGCTGLSLGAAVTSVSMLAYVLAPDAVMDHEVGPFAVLAGLVLVAVGFASIVADPASGKAHASSNALLLVGFFLVVAGVLEATGDQARGLVALLLCYLWLDARIELSKWNHARVCAACPEACKAYCL